MRKSRRNQNKASSTFQHKPCYFVFICAFTFFLRMSELSWKDWRQVFFCNQYRKDNAELIKFCLPIKEQLPVEVPFLSCRNTISKPVFLIHSKKWYLTWAKKCSEMEYVYTHLTSTAFYKYPYIASSRYFTTMFTNFKVTSTTFLPPFWWPYLTSASHLHHIYIHDHTMQSLNSISIKIIGRKNSNKYKTTWM